jgi:transposase InsO family protein
LLVHWKWPLPSYITPKLTEMEKTVVLELYSRQVIGCSLGERNNAGLVGDALNMEMWRRGLDNASHISDIDVTNIKNFLHNVS